MLCFLCGGITAQEVTTIRVDAAGPAYTDSSSNAWSADTGYSGGHTTDFGAINITGTSDPTLYRTERWGVESYDFSVPNGTYQVKLHFAENYYVENAGVRVFSVQLEGATVISDLDIYAEAGAYTALIKTSTVTVSDGQLNITFVPQVENPLINAIEIVSQGGDTQAPTAPTSLAATAASTSQINLTWTASTDNIGVASYLIERCQGSGCSDYAQIATATSTTYSNTGLSASTSYRYRIRATDAAGNVSSYSNTPSATTQSPGGTTIRVNAAGVAYTDSSGNVWSADTGYSGGHTTDFGPISIAGASDPTVYRTERWGVESYDFSVPNGSYQVKLHFAENYYVYSAGIRVFSVQLEGATAISDLDIYAQAGAHTALTRTSTVTVSDGQLNIVFVSQVENPIINAIEVLSQDGDTQAPTTPTSFTAAAASSSQISLSWTASTDDVGVTNYLIERCQGSGCSNYVQITTTTSTTYSNTGLAASTSYSYRVRATDAAGNLSGYSSASSATTQASADTQAPTAPTSLTATAASSSQINLSWNASTDNVAVTGYRIERCQGVSCSTFAEMATPTTTSYSDTGLAASTSYSYRVRAIDAADNFSSYSSTVSTSTPAPPDTQAPTLPTGLSASVVSTDQINLSWTASTDNVGVTGYLLERCQGVACSSFAQIATPTTTTYSDTGLSPATSYSYRLRATDAASNTSNYSSIATATTLAEPDTQAPTAPNGLAAAALSGTQISLSWGVATDNVGVTAYLLERCQGAGCSSFSQITSLAGNSYTDSGLTQNTSYTYRVRAADAASNVSGYSSSASATTQYTGPITFTYTYDALGRISHAAGSDGSSIDYQYDANGNATMLNRQ